MFIQIIGIFNKLTTKNTYKYKKYKTYNHNQISQKKQKLNACLHVNKIQKTVVYLFFISSNYIHIKIKKGNNGDNYVVTMGEYGAVGILFSPHSAYLGISTQLKIQQVSSCKIGRVLTNCYLKYLG